MRIRFVLALMVAGILCAAGVASAQQTTTEPLSDYTTTTNQQPATTNDATTTETTTTKEEPTPATQGESESSVAPTVAAQPAGSAPSTLAFTGAEPLLLIIAGLALAGGTATLLVRERRRSQDR